LTASQLHCATVSDGPDSRWEGGTWQRIKAKNRATLEAHFDKLDSAATADDFCTVCRREDDLVDRMVMAADGYPPRGHDQWETICRDCLAKRSTASPPMPTPAQCRIPDDLSIPQFLRRPLPQQPEPPFRESRLSWIASPPSVHRERPSAGLSSSSGSLAQCWRRCAGPRRG
jgi:hypothetical protein